MPETVLISESLVLPPTWGWPSYWGEKTNPESGGRPPSAGSSLPGSPLTPGSWLGPPLSQSQQKDGRLNSVIHFSFSKTSFGPK